MTSPDSASLTTTIEVGVVVALIVAAVVAVMYAAARHWLQQIKHELVPNSGKSMRDVADRTERAVNTLAEHVRVQGLQITRVETRLDDHIIVSAGHNAAAMIQAASFAQAAQASRDAISKE